MAKKVLLKVAPPAGDPVKTVTSEGMLLNPHNPISGDFDLRDRLAELVGKGNTLSPEDKKAIFGSLVGQLGQDKAIKVMNHAYIFNQRPEVVKLPLEDKLRAFYNIGSNDADVNNIIAKSKSLGYGPVQGFRESASVINQGLNGKIPATTSMAVSPEVQKKVMVKVSK
jgi:hypothetical protein